MSDALVAGAVRNAAHKLSKTIVIATATIVVVLPIWSVIVVHQAAKWRIESIQSEFQQGLEKAAAERQSQP